MAVSLRCRSILNQTGGKKSPLHPSLCSSANQRSLPPCLATFLCRLFWVQFWLMRSRCQPIRVDDLQNHPIRIDMHRPQQHIKWAANAMCTRFGLLTHSYLNVLTHPNCNSVHMPKKDKATEACGFSTHWKQECGRGGEGVKQSINLTDVIRREKFLPAPATARCRSVNYGRDMWQRNLGTKKQGTWAMQNIDATQLCGSDILR